MVSDSLSMDIGPRLLTIHVGEPVPSGSTLDSVTFIINGVPVTLDIYLREDAPADADPRTTELGRKGRCVVACRDATSALARTS